MEQPRLQATFRQQGWPAEPRQLRGQDRETKDSVRGAVTLSPPPPRHPALCVILGMVTAPSSGTWRVALGVGWLTEATKLGPRLR